MSFLKPETKNTPRRKVLKRQVTNEQEYEVQHFNHRGEGLVTPEDYAEAFDETDEISTESDFEKGLGEG